MSDNEKRETHADIIAEMHRFAKQHEYDHPDMDTNARGIEDYAYRLEAAHGRELARLREALEAVKRVGYPHNFQHEAYHIRSYCEEITWAIRKCNAALAATETKGEKQ